MFTLGNRSGEVDGVAAKLFGVARMVGMIVFGFLPLLFIPYSFTSLGYTKIVIATVALLFSAMLFAFSVLRQGSVRTHLEVPLLLMWLSFAIATVSSLFSQDFFDSFWGTELTSHSAVFMGMLALTATVWASLGTNKATVVKLYFFLAISAVFLAVFHLLRIVFGVDFLSFGIFGGGLVATPFSEWNGLAIFFGLVVILSLIALEQLVLSFAGRVVFGVVVVASLLMLSIINFKAVFFVLGLFSLVMLVYALTKGHFKDSQMLVTRESISSFPITISLATLVVSILFIVGGSAVGGFVAKMSGVSYIEVRPSLQATIGVAKEVYRDHLLLGVGPNRFVDVWRLHRDSSINSTIFWNTNFQAGYGYLPTIFVTQGVLGGLVWLVFFGVFVFVGVRSLLRAVNTDMMWYFITLSSFVASVYLWGMSLIYVPGPVLLLFAAMCTGIFLAARRAHLPQSGFLCSVTESSHATFLTISATVLVVVVSVGSLYYMSRFYVATAVYTSAFVSLQQGGNQIEAVQELMRAFEISKDDLFARQVAAYEQVRLQEKVAAILGQSTLDETMKNELQQSIIAAVNNAQMAVSLDGTEPENYAVLGRAYATTVPLNIEQGYELAKQALEKARDLDPKNPTRLVALAELELLKGNKTEARDNINKAIALKSNYTDAMYMLTQIEIADGNVVGAIESTRALTFLDAGNPVRFFQLGVLQYSAKQVKESIASFEQAIALSPEYSNARYFLAFAYDSVGQKDAAASELQEVLLRNPDNAEVKSLILSLAQNGTLSAPVAPSASSTASREPISESSEDAPDQGAATSGKAPDSPLLSPVNGDTTKAQE